MSGTDAAPEKVSRARYEWPESGPDWNGPYTYADLERRFEQLLARPPGQRVGAFDEADDARLSALATFARRLAEWHRPAAPDADAAP